MSGIAETAIALTGLVMFGMDVTLTGGHFLSVLQRPLPMLIGVTRAFRYSRLPGSYWLPRCLGRDERAYRNQVIEAGMQNSGLAVALAVKYFSATGCHARRTVRYLAQPWRLVTGCLPESSVPAIVFQRSFSRRCSSTM